MATKEDKLTLSYFNNILTKINNLCTISRVSTLEILKSNGDFLFAEDLTLIEEKLRKLSNVWGFIYRKKQWVNLTTISYLDINRWEQTISKIDFRIKNGNKTTLYPGLSLYPRTNLYPHQKGV